MQTNEADSALLGPALAVIKQYDPDTYARMQAAYWPVHAVTDGHEFMPVFEKEGAATAWELAESLSTGFGVTMGVTDDNEPGQVDDTPEVIRHSTWLNIGTIREASRDYGFDTDQFTADVLVHEFAHREGFGHHKPGNAFEVGTAFALKLGDQAMAVMSEKTRAQVQGKDALGQLMRELGLRFNWPAYAVLVDGIAWRDADGNTTWPERDAVSVAVHAGGLGYAEVEVLPA